MYTTHKGRFLRKSRRPFLIVFTVFMTLLGITLLSCADGECPNTWPVVPFVRTWEFENEEYEVDKTPFSDKTIIKNVTKAEEIHKKIKLLCFIPTTWQRLDEGAKAVNVTWGQRCDKLLFVVSGGSSARIIMGNVLVLNKLFEGGDHLTAKSIRILRYLYRHYLSDYDWFLRADDDTYIIVENLKFLLFQYVPDEPVAVGRNFRLPGKSSDVPYFSGGAGYVMNKAALQTLVEKGLNVWQKCKHKGNDEDVDISTCLLKSGVGLYKSIDLYGRQIFNPHSIENLVVGSFPKWLYDYDVHPVAEKRDCCSQLTVSFHFTKPSAMLVMDFLLYRISVYGHIQEPDSLNHLLNPVTEPAADPPR